MRTNQTWLQKSLSNSGSTRSHRKRHMMGRIALATLFAASLSVGSQPAAAESLQQAIELAYQNNPSLKARQADTRASDEPVRQAKAAFGPTLSGSAGYDYTKDKIRGATGSSNNSGFGLNYALQLSQPLYTFGRLSSRLRAARLGGQIGREALRQREMQLVNAVISSYVALIRDQQLVHTARENVRQLENQAVQFESRLKLRDTTITDVEQTKSRLAFGRAQLESAIGNYQSSRETYRALVGKYPGELSTVPALPVLPATIAAAYEIGGEYSPDLIIASLNEQISRANLAAARADLGPTISLTGSASKESSSPVDDSFRRTTYVAGVTISMPLYNGGLLNSRAREAKARNEADFYRIEQARRDMRQDIAQTWDQLSASRNSLPHLDSAVTSARLAAEGAIIQARSGQKRANEVLEATRDLLNASNAATRAQANAYIQHANLLFAMGILEPSLFGPSQPLYDPDSYAPASLDGLPTAPLIEAIDGIVEMDSVDRPEIQVEQDDGAQTMPVAPTKLPQPNWHESDG